jgi:hypothetical protein
VKPAADGHHRNDGKGKHGFSGAPAFLSFVFIPLCIHALLSLPALSALRRPIEDRLRGLSRQHLQCNAESITTG